jgi:hypothetical protein
MITLISKETVPAGLTLYLAIDLNNGAKAMTGVYFPDGYPGDKKLDLILYLHGHDAPPINEYWKQKQFKLRECWGFDCLYHPSNNPFKKEEPTDNTSDTEENWFYWAQLNPQAKLFVYYTDQGGTKTRSENLGRFVKNDPRFNINLGFGNINRGNAIVSKSDAPAHNDVPKRYLKERINACVLR